MGLPGLLARSATHLLVAASALACGSPVDPGPGQPSPATPTPAAGLPAGGSTSWGWVAPDPNNPRYLWLGGTGGRPFSITSYGSLAPCSFTGGEAAYLKSQGATYAVVWHQWSGCRAQTPNWFEASWVGPWRLACDPRDPGQRALCPERPRWDLAQSDDVYWRHLEDVVAAADDGTDGTGRRLVVRVHLFTRQDFGAGRDDNPFRGGNNVNGVRCHESDAALDPSLRYFARAAWLCAAGCEEPARSLFAYQQAYVRRLVDATYRHGNVIYELMNEPPTAEDPGSEGALAFSYFTSYWASFVKNYLAQRYGVARLVSQDQGTGSFDASAVDIGDARWASDASAVPDSRFLSDVLAGLASAVRESYLTHGKVTTLDEFGNAEVDPDRLRKEVWTIVTSGGHFHLEDPCNPEFRDCDGLSAQPWLPVRSIEAFKAASGWQFDRARPVHRGDSPSSRWFFWMVQDSPEYDKVGFQSAGVQDHVGYLAARAGETCFSQPLESDLPGLPAGATQYVARLWLPSGTDYLRDAAGRVLEHRFAWGGGRFDWCQTPLRSAILESEDLVFHVHAGREGGQGP